MGPEEIKTFIASLNQDEPQAAPLTPAVQQDVLSSRHLPPTTLPSFGTRLSGNLSSDSSTHLRSAKASRTDRDTDLRAELQEVIQQNRALEEHQAALLRCGAHFSTANVARTTEFWPDVTTDYSSAFPLDAYRGYKRPLVNDKGQTSATTTTPTSPGNNYSIRSSG